MSDTQPAEVPSGTQTSDPSDNPAPTQTSNRIASLDVIRGFAVLGILAANIVAFGQPFGAYMWPDAFLTDHGAASDWLWVTQFVLVDGKMRGLFTLLFGAGLALFMEKSAERGASRWLQVRRLCWLLVFGLIHFFLIWRGDILILYSLMGFVAVAFLRMEPMNQLVLGLLGYALGAVMYLLTLATPFLIVDTPLGDMPALAESRETLTASVAEASQDDLLETEILTNGSYADFVQHNFSAHLDDPIGSAIMFALETLPLMLIGMALYRFGLFSGGLNQSRQRLWGWIGLVGGGLANLLIALWIKAAGLTYWGTLAAFLSFSHLPRLPMILGLAALLALWGGQANGWLAQRLSAAGRMAFSNYLGTSLLMMLVFHPWAGGLWGKLTRPELYVVMALAWVVMLAWSKPWLAQFRYGPLEWLWRCLTYWTLFPLRRRATPS